MLLIETREQAPFNENVSAEWMRRERIPLDYHNKKLKLQFTSLSAYCKLHDIKRQSRFFHYGKDEFPFQHGLHGCDSFPTLIDPFRGPNVKLGVMAEKRGRHRVWRAYFPGKMMSSSIAGTRCSMELQMLWKSRQRCGMCWSSHQRFR